MASKTHSPRNDKNIHNGNESNLEDAQTGHRVLMPREYYKEKHPWFGSRIHYTIDVFRQLIKDAKSRKQPSSKDGS